MKNFFFSFLLLGVIFLAWLFPEVGSSSGVLKAKFFSQVGIFFIFLSYGYMLKKEAFLVTFSKLKLHLFIQFFSFLLIPFFVFIADRYLSLFDSFPLSVSLGITVIAVLPTTISSSILFTEKADGDHSSALFNAIISNFIAVFLSPFLLKLLLQLDQEAILFNPWPLIFKLSYMTLLPLLLGQLLRKVIKKTIPHSIMQKANSGIILFISYSTFCNSFVNEEVISSSGELLLILFLLHSVFLALAYIGGLLFSFEKKERLAILFTAPQKTVAMGALIILALSHSTETPPIYLLPLILYHQIQLLTAANLLPLLKKLP